MEWGPLWAALCYLFYIQGVNDTLYRTSFSLFTLNNGNVQLAALSVGEDFGPGCVQSVENIHTWKWKMPELYLSKTSSLQVALCLIGIPCWWALLSHNAKEVCGGVHREVTVVFHCQHSSENGNTEESRISELRYFLYCIYFKPQSFDTPLSVQCSRIDIEWENKLNLFEF